MTEHYNSIWFHPLLLNFVPKDLEYETSFDDSVGVYLDNTYDSSSDNIYELLQFLISVELPIVMIVYDRTSRMYVSYHCMFGGRESVIDADRNEYPELNDRENEILKFYTLMDNV